MPFDLTSNVYVERDASGAVRQLRHLQQPYAIAALAPRALAASYVRDVMGIYELPAAALTNLENPYRENNLLTPETVRLRFAAESPFLDTTTIVYVETFRGLPIWEAGFSVTVQAGPNRVTSSCSTLHRDVSVEIQRKEKGWKPYLPKQIQEILDLGARERKLEITSQRRLIYLYEANFRSDPESRSSARKGRDLKEEVALEGPKPTLPLAPVPKEIESGRHYVVTEVLFTTDPGGPTQMHWRVFIEDQTESVVYLRALVSCALCNVFDIDPVTNNGNGALNGCSGDATLDPLQTTVSVALTAPTAGNPQALTGQYVKLSDFRTPTLAPPVSPPTSFTAVGSDSAEFGAVNAYYHVDRFFRLMLSLGFDPATFFSSTSLPLPVDHVDTTNGFLQAWTYSNAGNLGCAGIGFAFTTPSGSCTNPVHMGADQRVAFHECSHLILLERIHAANFGFCHSTGDSLAVIFADPASLAPDRFLSFPFIAASTRRHDRDVTMGWAWGGTNDDAGYGSEQILSTTQFRLYRSTGGDDDRNDVKGFASNYILYTIIRAVGSLGPGTITPTPTADVWATALMNADAGTSSFGGVPGGTIQKVIRWAFEKQGLYQPSGAPAAPNVVTQGAPPPVDVYIDDGRGGEYQYLEGFWNNQDIWNRNAADGGTTHETPIVGVPNFAYVRVKNRGSQTANNVVVSGYHCSPSSGLMWPDDWTPMTTATINGPAIVAGGSAVIGPFTWTPEFIGHECMLMAASADGDLSNIDSATSLPCAAGPTPHWRLVPFDNNLGQRNVAPVAGGGGSGGLLESLTQRRFTAKNPFERPVRITLEPVLPKFLLARGWSVRFDGAGGNSFSLPARGQREVRFSLVPGVDFAPSDVPQGTLIEIRSRVEGLLIGGMSYLVDPQLKTPPRERSGSEGQESEPRRIRCHPGAKVRIVIEVDCDRDDRD